MSFLALGIGALIASAVSGIVGSAINSAQQEKTNEANLQLTRENNAANLNNQKLVMEYNSAEAQKERDWEEMMANTAVQRRMEDLKGAGVNPMLALGSPAATIGGPAASASTVQQRAGEVYNPRYGDSLNSLASLAQSAAFMAALGHNAELRSANSKPHDYDELIRTSGNTYYSRSRRYH